MSHPYVGEELLWQLKMNFDSGNQLVSSRIYIDVALVCNRLGARLTSINISESVRICIKVAPIGQQRGTALGGISIMLCGLEHANASQLHRGRHRER